MGLKLWKKKRLIRRYSEPVNEGGFSIPMHHDFYIMADVQTTDNTTTTKEDGDHSVQNLKVFTETRIHVANEKDDVPGDRLWFQGRWFECRSARLSENTFLKHWTCTFTECANQDEEPPIGDPNKDREDNYEPPQISKVADNLGKWDDEDDAG